MSSHEETNLRPSDSALRCSTTEPQTLRWARSITKFIWHASCILLGSAISIASWGLRIFSLSLARDKTKNVFLWSYFLCTIEKEGSTMETWWLELGSSINLSSILRHFKTTQIFCNVAKTKTFSLKTTLNSFPHTIPCRLAFNLLIFTKPMDAISREQKLTFSSFFHFFFFHTDISMSVWLKL